MAQLELRKTILSRLKGQPKTLAQISARAKASKKAIKDTIMALVSEGAITQEADRYFVTPSPPTNGNGRAVGEAPRIELSEMEWQVIRFVKHRKQADSSDVAKELGAKDASDTLSKLVAAGILVKKGQWYTITAASAMRIPLSADERELLQAAEGRIDTLVEEVIVPKQMEVAGELRKIRDGKLYRETHGRFKEYVEQRFERTRDWAYKLIRDLEVCEGLMKVKAEPNVEALLQTVTARDMPHLAKLKKDPAMMRAALETAKDQAKSKNRPRTADDLKEVVEAVTGKKPKKEKPKAPSKVRTVEFSAVDPKLPALTDDVATLLTDFAKWLRKNPTDAAFTIKVGEAFVAPDQK
jgi:hypothetical protein